MGRHGSHNVHQVGVRRNIWGVRTPTPTCLKTCVLARRKKSLIPEICHGINLVVMTTTSIATSDNKVGFMTTRSFQYCASISVSVNALFVQHVHDVQGSWGAWR